jgi:hypothetical protein
MINNSPTVKPTLRLGANGILKIKHRTKGQVLDVVWEHNRKCDVTGGSNKGKSLF